MARVIRGVLTYGNGDPVAAAVLTLICVESAPGEYHVAKGTEISATTDLYGRYIFPVVGDGVYRVSQSVPGATRSMLGEITVVDGGDVDLQTLLSLSAGNQQNLITSLEALAQNVVLGAVQREHASQHEAMGMGHLNHPTPRGAAIVGDSNVKMAYAFLVSGHVVEGYPTPYDARSFNSKLRGRVGLPANKLKVFPDGTVQWSACGGTDGSGEGYGAPAVIGAAGAVWAESETAGLGCGFIIDADTISSAAIDGTEHDILLSDNGSHYYGRNPYVTALWYLGGALELTGIFGVDGEDTAGLLTWMDMVRERDSFCRPLVAPPAKIVLSIGKNDAFRIDAGVPGYSLAATKENLMEIVDRFLEYAEVILETIVFNDPTSTQHEVITELNAYIKSLVHSRKNLKILDSYSILLDRNSITGAARAGSMANQLHYAEVGDHLVASHLSRLLMDADAIEPEYTHLLDRNNLLQNGALHGTAGVEVAPVGWPEYLPRSLTGNSCLDYAVVSGDWTAYKEASPAEDGAPDWQVYQIDDIATLSETDSGALLVAVLETDILPEPAYGEYYAYVDLRVEWPDVSVVSNCDGVSVEIKMVAENADGDSSGAVIPLATLTMFPRNFPFDGRPMRIKTMFPMVIDRTDLTKAYFSIGIFGAVIGTKVAVRSPKWGTKYLTNIPTPV